MIVIQNKMMEHLAMGVDISSASVTTFQALMGRTSTTHTTEMATAMGLATDAQEAALLGSAGVGLRHLDDFLHVHLDGF